MITPPNDAARSLPETGTRFGFRYGSKGTLTSRTIMLAELDQVLGHVHPECDRTDYATAIIEENVTDKKTAATRRHTNQRLSELYGLNPSVTVFRVLRRFWGTDVPGRPLLALLCALARDPLLRASAPTVFDLRIGEELPRQQMSEAIHSAVGNRLNEDIADKVVRNASSSWTQSGHLKGRVRKIRQRVRPTPLSVAYALLLGYLLGARGRRLFSTIWARTLDVTADELLALAGDAKRFGAIDVKQAGDVIDIGFSSVLTLDEIRGSHGTD